MRLVRFALFALVAMLFTLGCGGGGGGTAGNFTMTMDFPAFNAGSANNLAKARSAWVFITTEGTIDRQWAGIFERPSDLGGSVTKHIQLQSGSTVKVEVLGYSDAAGSGTIVGQKTLTGQTVGSTVTVTSL